MTEIISTSHYTSYALVRDFLNGFGLDELVTVTKINETLLKFCDAYFDNECQRDFKLHSGVVEFHNGNGKNLLNTHFFPIVRINRVIMYNQLLQAMRVFLDTELIIYPERGEIALPPIYPAFLTDKPFQAIFGNIFIPGIYNVEVDYDYGFAEPPMEIQYAATKWVSIELLKTYGAQMSAGMTSRSIDGYSEAFGKLPYEGLINSWQKDIDQVTTKFKRVYARAV